MFETGETFKRKFYERKSVPKNEKYSVSSNFYKENIPKHINQYYYHRKLNDSIPIDKNVYHFYPYQREIQQPLKEVSCVYIQPEETHKKCGCFEIYEEKIKDLKTRLEWEKTKSFDLRI